MRVQPPAVGSGGAECPPHGRGECQALASFTFPAPLPQAVALINRGQLVSDAKILELLLNALLDPAHGAEAVGAVVDGCPRTATQVDFLRLLHDRLKDLHQRFVEHPALSGRYPRPNFKLVVLYCDEAESVRRQLARGQAAGLAAARAQDAGLAGASHLAVRATDMDEETARRRYKIFKQHYGTLLRLKAFFPFHLIDAMGTVAEAQAQIGNELRYQSSLELAERTYQAIRHIPKAMDLVQESRQQLVKRLDGYAHAQPRVFQDVVALTDHEARRGRRRLPRRAPPPFSEPALPGRVLRRLCPRCDAARWQGMRCTPPPRRCSARSRRRQTC